MLSVIGAIQRPVVLSVGDDVRLGVSVGLATFDAADGIDASEALRRADLAMYAAKAAGRSGFAWFDHRLDEIRKRRSQLDRDLRLALERDELFLVCFNRNLILKAVAWKGSRRCCAGTTPSKALCRLQSSFPLLKRTD